MRLAVIHSSYLDVPEQVNVNSDSFSKAGALAYIRGNLSKNYRMLSEAGEKGADLAITNEDFGAIGMYIRNLRYPKLFGELTAELEKEIAGNISQIAKKYRMNITANEYETAGGNIFNTSVFYNRDGIRAGSQQKIHLPPGERIKVTAGEKPCVIETDIGVIGFCICYDIIFPEYCRVLTLMGADIIVHQTQGWGMGGIPANEAGKALVCTRAVENSVYFMVAKNIQIEGGMSCILDSHGRILAHAPSKTEQVITADITPDFKKTEKYHFDNYYAGVESTKARSLLGRRPEIYGILTDPHPTVLENYPGERLCNGEELAARIRALSEMEQADGEERKKYHWFVN